MRRRRRRSKSIRKRSSDFARSQGVKVAEGDAGNRLAKAANGETVDKKTNPELFKEKFGDKGFVVVNGQKVEARLQTANARTLAISAAQASANAVGELAGSSGNYGVQKDNIARTARVVLRRISAFGADSNRMMTVLGPNVKGPEASAILNLNRRANTGIRESMEGIISSSMQLSRNVANNTSSTLSGGSASFWAGLAFFGLAGAASLPFGGLAAGGGAATVAGTLLFGVDGIPGSSGTFPGLKDGLQVSDRELKSMMGNLPANISQYRDKLKKAGLSQHEGVITNAMKGMKETGRRVVQENKASMIFAQMANDGGSRFERRPTGNVVLDLGKENAAKLKKLGWGAKWYVGPEVSQPIAGDSWRDIGVFRAWNEDGKEGLTKTTYQNRISNGDPGHGNTLGIRNWKTMAHNLRQSINANYGKPYLSAAAWVDRIFGQKV